MQIETIIAVMFVLTNVFSETMGISNLIPAAQCDLQLNESTKGLLSSMPFFGNFTTSLMSINYYLNLIYEQYSHINTIPIAFRHDDIKLHVGLFGGHKRTEICNRVDSFVFNYFHCYFNFCTKFLDVFVHEISYWNFVSILNGFLLPAH